MSQACRESTKIELQLRNIKCGLDSADKMLWLYSDDAPQRHRIDSVIESMEECLVAMAELLVALRIERGKCPSPYPPMTKGVT